MTLTTKQTVLAAAVAVLAGCEFQGPRKMEMPTPAREAPEGLTIDGYAHDIEYFMASWFSCANPMECPPPLLGVGLPPVEGGKVYNAKVSVIAPGGAEIAAAPGLTGFDGNFSVPSVKTAEPFVYLHSKFDATAPMPEGEGFPRIWHPDMAFVPTYPWVATTTATPIYVTGGQRCMSTRAVNFGKQGVVAAIAKFLSSFGAPTTADDLLDPTKTGGLVIWWNRVPDELYVWVPGFGTHPKFAIAGKMPDEQLPVSFLPPGMGPPFQVPYGYTAADPEDPETWMGLAALILPPTDQPFTEVTVTTTDEVNGWTFEPVTVKARTGEITYGESIPVGGGTVFGGPPGPEFCATPY